MAGTVTERGTIKRKSRFEGEEERCVESSILEVLSLRCQLETLSGQRHV